MMRTSTLSVSFPPTRSKLFSCSARSSFTCVPSGISLASSKKSVPPSACLKRPSRRETAPVNAPRSWPKSSLSSRPSASAAQFNRTSGLSARGEAAWIASAMSSLPVPLSPVMSTLARGGTHLRDQREDLLHLRVVGDDVMERVAVAQPVPEAPRLLEEARLLHRALDDRGERLVLERLGQVVVGAALHRVDRARDRPERRHHDEHRAGRRGAGLVHERDPVEAGHFDVRQDDVRGELFELAEGLEPVGGGLGLIPLVVENFTQRGTGVCLVVDDENPTAGSHM